MSVIARLARARLRDRRRRHLHAGPARRRRAARRRAPSTPTTTAARCRSCASSARSSRTRSITPGHDPEFYSPELERALRVARSPASYESRRTAAEDLASRPRAGARGSAPPRPGRRAARRTATVTLGKRSRFQRAHPRRAVDRDRDDRRAGFERDPADPRFRLAQLAAARAAALGVDRAASRPGRGA